MVPGSTFRYGSNFCSETVRPRLSRRQPIEAAEMPLPSEETTPPVTKINLLGAPEVLGIPHSGFIDRGLSRAGHLKRRLLAGAQQHLDAFQIGRRIHAEGFV